MKTLKKFLQLSVILLISGQVARSQWTIDSLNTAGIYPYNAATSDHAVFTNGTEWNVFNANTNAHTFGNLSFYRINAQTATSGDKVYIGGGKYGPYTDPQFTNRVDVYDATSNTWSTLTLSKAREVGGAGSAAGKIVFGGGRSAIDIHSSVDIFDAATGVRITAKLSKGRDNIAVGSAGSKIVFAGGWFWDINYNVLESNVADIYDASTNSWTKSTLSIKRENIAVATVGNKIIFAGGTGGKYGGPVTNVDIYDASANSWSTTNLPVARYGMKSAVVGDNAYFAGGMFDPVQNAVDIYNVTSNTWATIYIPVSLAGFSMSVIENKIYFAGGYDSGTGIYSDLVQIFDPTSLTWSTAHLSVGRNSIAALTCGNKGYFAGGVTAYGYPIPVTTKRVDILSIASPVADFTASSTVITAGETVTFTDLSINNPTSWLWIFNGGIPSTSNLQNPAGIQYNSVGVYDVTLTATNSLGSGTLTKTAYITVNPTPCGEPTGLNSTNITSTTATLSWSGVSGASKYQVAWKVADNSSWTSTTTTTTSKQITGLVANMTYLWKVKTICSNGLSSAFTANQSFTTLSARLSEFSLSGNCMVYPNPFSDQFKISISEDMSLPMMCTMFDVYGKIVRQVEITDYVQMINSNDLPAGNYLITLSNSENKRVGFKMIKQ